MCNETFQTFLLLMNTKVTKAKIWKNQNVDFSTTVYRGGFKLIRRGLHKLQINA